MRNKNYLFIVLCSIILTGCSMFKSIIPITLKDGRQAFVVSCSNTSRGWGLCLENAAKICQGYDFEIVNTLGSGVGKEGVFYQGPWDILEGKAMTITCRNTKSGDPKTHPQSI